MVRKAIDIALLPDEKTTNKAIELNRQLVENFDAKIVLSKEDCLPHISLAMGVIDDGNVCDISEVLQSIAGQFSLRELKVTGIVISTNAAGENVSALEVKKTDELQGLHETVMGRLAGYLKEDVREDMIYGGEAEDSTLEWIKNYRSKSSFENFLPHITIGYGRIKIAGFEMDFSASKLALCHLGNHCTCRKVLSAYNLTYKLGVAKRCWGR